MILSCDKCALKMAGIAAQVQRVASGLGYDNLRPLQVEVITAFVDGRNVFVSLPTGSGKSLCYSLLPPLFDLLRNVEKKPSSVVL